MLTGYITSAVDFLTKAMSRPVDAAFSFEPTSAKTRQVAKQVVTRRKPAADKKQAKFKPARAERVVKYISSADTKTLSGQVIVRVQKYPPMYNLMTLPLDPDSKAQEYTLPKPVEADVAVRIGLGMLQKPFYVQKAAWKTIKTDNELYTRVLRNAYGYGPEGVPRIYVIGK